MVAIEIDLDVQPFKDLNDAFKVYKQNQPGTTMTFAEYCASILTQMSQTFRAWAEQQKKAQQPAQK